MSKKDKTKTRRKPFFITLIDQIKQDKKAYIVFLVLSLLILGVVVHSIVARRYENLFTGLLASALLLIPPFIEKSFRVKLPTTLEILAYAFVFCAEILGEIGNFYHTFPFWDLMLHTFNGFMFAAFGFSLVDILNRGKANRHEMSPVFLAFVAFCFSMTIGVMWEFIEFGIDSLLLKDMQKDFLVSNIYSVTFDPEKSNKVVALKEITKTIITMKDGSTVTIDGYLDIGLVDTMKDLLVNLIGAIVFSVIGFFYVKHRGKGKFAGQFIPKFKEDSPTDSPTE